MPAGVAGDAVKVALAVPPAPAAGVNAVRLNVPGSPATTDTLRRNVLSAVLVTPVPHSVPGSKPTWPMLSITVVPLRSTTASSPLNQPGPLVWSATAKIGAEAALWASTYTSPSATVPVRLTVRPAVGLPLKNIWTLYPLVAKLMVAPVSLKISSALLFDEPSTYSEKNSSVEAAAATLVVAVTGSPATNMLTSAPATTRMIRAAIRSSPRTVRDVGAGLLRSPTDLSRRRRPSDVEISQR